jgi:hypothetical protein
VRDSIWGLIFGEIKKTATWFDVTVYYIGLSIAVMG